MLPPTCADTSADARDKRLLKRPLTVREILAWADRHHQDTGQWPTKNTHGEIAGARFETWPNVDNALRVGLRGLPGGTTLARLLAERRGVRNRHALTPLRTDQILAWADAHFARTGQWPIKSSGQIPETTTDTWLRIDNALRKGGRGLPGESSLPQLLAEQRGARNRRQLPPFTESQIVAWAEAHHRCTGTWPSVKSGPIADAPGETWLGVEGALRSGARGLPGGSSLALLLAERCGARNRWTQPDLSVTDILRWADAFHERIGRWPQPNSGTIPETSAETWCIVDHALNQGTRGLPGGFSLAELLAVERQVRNKHNIAPLRRKDILAWADAHFRRTGQWPQPGSGPIPEAPGETWGAVNAALNHGRRGLKGRSSLARLLAKYRGKRVHTDQSPLTLKKILAWADGHHEKTGRWPTSYSGDVLDAPGEKWRLIDGALRVGLRNLTGGSSLARLLARKRGARNALQLPPVTETEILCWADRHRDRAGKYPVYKDGRVADAPGETWAGLDGALRRGRRGLRGGSSLAKLLAQAGKSMYRHPRGASAGAALPETGR